MADDFNLRAAAKQSFDNIFKSAYPQLSSMITSVNEEVDKLTQDTKRETKHVTLSMETFADKFLVTKNSITSLVREQDKINEYYKKLLDAVEDMEISDKGAGGGGGLPTPDVIPGGGKNTKKAPAATTPAPKSKAKKAGAAGLLGLLGYGTYKALTSDNDEEDSSDESAGTSKSQPAAPAPVSSNNTSQAKPVKKNNISSLPNDRITPAKSVKAGGGQSDSGGPDDEDDLNSNKKADATRTSGSSGGGMPAGEASTKTNKKADGSKAGSGTPIIQKASYGPSQTGKTTESSGEKPKNVSHEGGVDVSKLDQSLLSSFYKAAEEFGEPVTITSGYRSDEKQAELYARWMSGEPGIYTPAKPVQPRTVTIRGKAYNVPGGGRGSSHSSGTALDSPQAAAMDKAGLLKKYGLHRPHATTGDPVHIQLINGGQQQQEVPDKAGTQIAARPTTGSNVNRNSIEAKVDKEKAVAAGPQMQINNLVVDNGKPASGVEPQKTASTGDVSSRERLAGLVAAA